MVKAVRNPAFEAGKTQAGYARQGGRTHETSKDQLSPELDALPVIVLWFIIPNQHVELAQRVDVLRQNLLFTLVHQPVCAHRDADRDHEDREHREEPEPDIFGRIALDSVVSLQHTHTISQVAASQCGERRLANPWVEHEHDDANNRIDALHVAPPVEGSDQVWEFAGSCVQDVEELFKVEHAAVVLVALENDGFNFIVRHVDADVFAAGGYVLCSHFFVFRPAAGGQAFVLVPQVLTLLMGQRVQVRHLVPARFPGGVCEESDDGEDCGEKRRASQNKSRDKTQQRTDYMPTHLIFVCVRVTDSPGMKMLE